MERLIILISIVIGITNLVRKQKESQGSMNRPQDRMRRNAGQGLKQFTRQIEKTVKSGQQGPYKKSVGKVYSPEPMDSSKSEGFEFEDRKRTGSLDYTEQSLSTEGICNEHLHYSKEKYEEVEAAYRADAKHALQDLEFDLTEENLLRSIILAEVLGPPRAVKRNIR